MKTIGIIAEYNPFHKGHEYQIREIRRRTSAEHIVIVMSGDFVQRGTPAWTDKFLRTEMALAGGADLVFELPVHFAAASAERFAYGGIALLHQLGFVDGVCFGCECREPQALSDIAEYLTAHDTEIQPQIQARMTQGDSYPAARAAILSQAFPELTRNHPGLLKDPNNILAVEYLKALRRLGSSMTPWILPRQGGAYHDVTPDPHYPSAASIRTHYAAAKTLPADGIPDRILALLKDSPGRYPVSLDDLSDMLYYKLRTMDASAPPVMDLSPELWQRIQKQLPHYQTVSQFAECIKTKQYTQTRIQRVLLHLLLDLYPSSPQPAYARLLGFRHSHSSLLRHPSAIPILTKVADAPSRLACRDAQEQFAADLRAHDLYRYLIRHKHPSVCLPDDYHSSVIRYPE